MLQIARAKPMTRSFEVSGVWMRAAQLLPALLLFIGHSFCHGAEPPADRGVLKGRFLYDGTPRKPEPLDTLKEPLCKQFNLVDESLVVDADGGLKNVLIFVVTKDVAPPPANKKPSDLTNRDVVILRMRHGRFEPHVLPMLVTQTLEIHYDDEFSHNVHVSEHNDVSPNLYPGPIVPYKYSKPSSRPLPIECNIHPWMKAYVLPRDNPYFAVSKEDGTFEIKDLPVGKSLEFQVWHEVAGNFSRLERKGWTKGQFTLTVKAGANDLGEIKLDSKSFERKR
jgi:hypothetical protein